MDTQHFPIDHFTHSQLELAARNAPDWDVEPVERAERPTMPRKATRKPAPVVHSRWADRAVWVALVLGALVALLVR
jgi:hypothetical protein